MIDGEIPEQKSPVTIKGISVPPPLSKLFDFERGAIGILPTLFRNAPLSEGRDFLGVPQNTNSLRGVRISIELDYSVFDRHTKSKGSSQENYVLCKSGI